MHSLTQQPITHSTVVVESQVHADDYSQLNTEGKTGLRSSICFQTRTHLMSVGIESSCTAVLVY